VFAGWRTGLPGPVLVLQAGTAVNYFGTGLILPFEILYLHQARGFPTATAGLVLAAVMGTAAVVTPPSGALLDRFRAKPILITGNLASALGYAGFAFVDRPWQAFACSAVGGAGFGIANTANQVLTLTLVSAEQRASSIALRRVAGNFGLGSGATVAGFIVASAQHLRAFQALYLFDGVTFAVFALVVLVGIPNPRFAQAAPGSDRGTGFRAVAHDRPGKGAYPLSGDKGSRRGAARAARAAATSGGTGTFEPWKPRNGRNDPSWTSSSSSDLSRGGRMRQSNRMSVRHRKCAGSAGCTGCSYVSDTIVAT
jgi:MFS family permease